MDFSIKIDDNSAKVKALSEEAVSDILFMFGTEAVSGAVKAISGKLGLPKAVDTGRLRASISFITPTESGSNEPVENSKFDDFLTGTAPERCTIVGTNVEYAEAVHNGTSRMVGRPFLKVGIEEQIPTMQEKAKRIMARYDK